jgi:hypothetical protein
VAVLVECEGGGVVTEVLLHGFHIVTGTERGYGVAMPLQYNRDKSEKPSNSKGLEDFRHEIFTLFQVKKPQN